MVSLDERRRALPHWWELAPELLVVVGLTFFLVDEPDAAISSFESLRAVALMAGVAIAWIAGRLLLTRVVAWPVRMAIFGAAGIAILMVVVVPAYDEDTVVEVFPGPSRAEPRAESRESPTEAPSSDESPPTLLRTGMFHGIDHRAAGTVSLYQRSDGTLVVGLERFDIQPGPDYDVYVVPGTDREDRDGGTRLDDLRGNQGTQYYDVPAGIPIDEGPWTVLIWCQTFGVPVAGSTPQAA